jgi:transcriptional antiterminator NusG
MGLKRRSCTPRVQIQNFTCNRGMAMSMPCEEAKSAPEFRWYALYTKSRQERVTSALLESLGVSVFLPSTAEVHQWSDRKRSVNVPLFPGYLFIRTDPWSKTKVSVLKAPGVVGFVGNHTGPLPIPDDEIENIRTLFQCGARCKPHMYLKEGDPVRIVRGPLIGIEGTLLRSGARTQLVISIHIIQRAVAVVVSEQDVEPIRTDSAGRLNADPHADVA